MSYNNEVFDVDALRKIFNHRPKPRIQWWEEAMSMMSPAMREATDEAIREEVRRYGVIIEQKHIDPVVIPENVAHLIARNHFKQEI